MTAFEEAVPELDVTSLARSCTDLAEQNEQYACQQHLTLEKEVGWMNVDCTEFRVGFAGRHIYNSARYLGQEFVLTLQVGRESRIVPAELRELVAMEGKEMPDDSHMAGIEVSYRARYTISPYNTLGWELCRIYDYYHDDENIDFETIAGNSGNPDEAEILEEEDTDANTGVEIVAARGEEVVRSLSYRRPSSAPEDDLGEVLDPFAALEDDIYLRQAQLVFEMLLFEDEGSFDLASIFPPEIVAELGAHSE